MNVRVILYCALGGGPLLLGALGAGQWTAWWLAGIVLALAFVPVALFGPRSVPGQFGTVAVALLIITALAPGRKPSSSFQFQKSGSIPSSH